MQSWVTLGMVNFYGIIVWNYMNEVLKIHLDTLDCLK